MWLRHMEMAVKYPLFRRPERYMQNRRGGLLGGALKRFAERRAMDRCLRGLADIRRVCDAPCGPGRLFPYWCARGFHVVGVDLSEPMVDAATTEHRQLGLAGSVLHGDAFHLKGLLAEAPDLVASIRFCYYFGRELRIELLRALAASTRRYVLVQYKTSETFKGMQNLKRHRRRQPHNAKAHCTAAEIMDEIEAAGLTCLRIAAIGQFSDRVFVLAEHPQGGATTRPRVRLGWYVPLVACAGLLAWLLLARH